LPCSVKLLLNLLEAVTKILGHCSSYHYIARLSLSSMIKNALLAIVLAPVLLTAQSLPQNTPRRKVIVGITVDQMRQEYIARFWNKFSDGGFKRLVNEGYSFPNVHYNYVPTVTGPGHASIYTGTTPALHGIISNDWYDKTVGREVNCVNDPKQHVVGNNAGNGDVSPWRLLTTTVTDELKLATQKRSKVLGLSIKDRGAVLPAGHMADGAYWYDATSGSFITSTYYTTKLPDWVQKFNQQKLADQYLNQTWSTLLPIEQYIESSADESPYESKFIGKDKSVFPYNLKELRKKNGDFDLLVFTPFANDLLTRFAIESIDAEKLGADEWVDFLCVSYSSTDILGHHVGPRAVELEDMYLRLDRNIAELLKTLDEKTGKGNYTVFLTADHAVADVAQYLTDNKIPSGYFSMEKAKADLNEFLKQYFPGQEVVELIDGDQIFLNQQVFQRDPKSSGVDYMVATELIINYLLKQDGVANVFSKSMIRDARFEESGVKGMVVRGHHPKRSGDIIIVLEPGWYSSTKVSGTTHGSPYTYDTNVPLLFFGAGIKHGQSVQYHPITDIAPTVSVLLGVKFPSGAIGQPIEALFE
jgi:predicted AlkP superfamily pyrophosphatase or phosphodiesterase